MIGRCWDVGCVGIIGYREITEMMCKLCNLFID